MTIVELLRVECGRCGRQEIFEARDLREAAKGWATLYAAVAAPLGWGVPERRVVEDACPDCLSPSEEEEVSARDFVDDDIPF